MKEPLIKANRVFKYSITFQETNDESREISDFSDSGFIIENETDEIGDILKLAQQTYGIYYPIAFGVWESTTPEQNAKYFEKGIETYYGLFIKNEDGTDITEEEYDFITFLLSDGNYNKSEFTDYAVGGVVLGALALGVGGLIGYYYFKNKKSSKKDSVDSRAKFVIHKINGKDRKFPIKDAWTKEHYHDNEDEDYEVEPSKRKVPARNRKYVEGGGVGEKFFSANGIIYYTDYDGIEQIERVDRLIQAKDEAEAREIVTEFIENQIGFSRDEWGDDFVEITDELPLPYLKDGVIDKKAIEFRGYLKSRKKKYVEGGGVNDYDFQDIGQFSMPDSEWKNYSQEDFNRIGRKIVEEQFNGDLTRAYDSIVHKRTYFVVSAKNDKVVSRGFDTEEEAKKEMYSMFEKTGDFSYAIKKFVNGSEVYIHPKNVRKPYLDKFKVSFDNYSEGSQVRTKPRQFKEVEVYGIKNENGWLLGFKGSSAELQFSPHTMPITFTSNEMAQEFIDRNSVKNPFIKKGVIVKLKDKIIKIFNDGGGVDEKGVDKKGVVERAKNKSGKWIFSITYADLINGKKVWRTYPNYVSEYFNTKLDAEKKLSERLSKYSEGGGVDEIKVGDLVRLKSDKNVTQLVDSINKDWSEWEKVEGAIVIGKDIKGRPIWRPIFNKYSNGGGVGETIQDKASMKFAKVRNYLKDKNINLWFLTNENIHSWYSGHKDMDEIKKALKENKEYLDALVLQKDFLKEVISEEKLSNMPLKKRLLRMKGFNQQINNIEKVLNEIQQYDNGGGVEPKVRGGIKYVQGQDLEWLDVMSFDIDTYGEKEAEKKAYDYIQDSIKYWKGELNEDDFNVRKSKNGNKGSWVVMRQFPKYAVGGTTTTRPTTTPEVVPDTDTKPSKPKTPFQPKHIPKPKARKYDFILIK